MDDSNYYRDNSMIEFGRITDPSSIFNDSNTTQFLNINKVQTNLKFISEQNISLNVNSSFSV